MMNIFKQPGPKTLAARELEEAQRELLRAQSAMEYATNMVAYHQARIARLSVIVGTAK